MTTLVAKWTQLAALPASLVRSSHSLAVIGARAYIFGGEFKPRTPVDATLSIINLADGSHRILSPPPKTSTSAPWPAPRVGSSLVAAEGALYLWGGRGGKDMGTFSADEDLWKFDVGREEWEVLRTTGDRPEQRSFHVMTAVGSTLYLHAGCPPKGRLATLHSLSLPTLTWSNLATAPLPGRGGTVLTPLPSSPSSSLLLARFGGFAGFELGGPLDLFDTTKGEWRSEDVAVEGEGEGPEKRSVHSLVGLEGGLEWQGKKVVAVMAHGEREGAPAELGHDGAGFFHADAWALLAAPSDPVKYTWVALEPSKSSTTTPEARGWFASAAAGGNRVVLQGGLNERNERLGDGWVLEVALE